MMLREEQIFQVHHAEHGFAIVVEEWVAAVAVTIGRIHVLRERCIAPEAGHFAHRMHEIGDGQIAEVDGVGDHIPVVARQFLARCPRRMISLISSAE